MKNLFVALSLTTLFVACKNKTIEPVNSSPAVMSAYTPVYESNYSTDKSSAAKVAEMGKATPVKKPVVNTPAVNNNNNGTVSNAPVAATTPAKKKGWSGRAKGAVIGGGSGAIIGAIANKNNRGTGAVVGGLIGAASGYVIGNEVEKKKERKNQ